mgnify:CR=1 FL=1
MNFWVMMPVSLDEAEDVRARRLVCQDGAVYVELFVEPQ